MPTHLINLFEITRGVCRTFPGPCMQTQCRFNMTSEARDNRGGKPVEEQAPVVRESCVLDAAERGGMTLTEIATRFALTRERIRQIEHSALIKLRERMNWDDDKPSNKRRSTRARDPHPTTRSQ